MLNLHNLQTISARLRLDILKMISRAGRGHIGGAFSCLDILVCLYYAGIMNAKPDALKDATRDRFI